MLRKICHWIFGLCIMGGVLIILGALGASDLNKIDGIELLKQGIFGFLVIGFNYIGLRLSGWRYIAE